MLLQLQGSENMIVAFNDLDVSLDDLIDIRRRIRAVMLEEPG